MNTQETLEELVRKYEERIRSNGMGASAPDVITAYCLCVIARSLTR